MRCVDSVQVACVVITLSGIEEVTVRVLDLSIAHAVPQDLFIVLGMVQNMHHFSDKALSSHSVLEFEPVRGEVQPIFDLLLVAITIVSDFLEDLDSFIAVISSVMDFYEGSAEHSILKRQDSLVKR